MTSDGTLAARYDFDPYGKRLTQYQSSTYTGGCDLGFTGHLTLSASVTGQTELDLTHFRVYDPALERWLSADPIGEKGGINLYEYVRNGPVSAMDPLGLDRWVVSSFGHVSVVVEDKSNSCSGYTRIQFGPASINLFNGPGMVAMDDTVRPSWWYSMRIPSTQTQDQALLDYAKEMQSDPPNYNAVGHNCRHAASVLKDVGMSARTNPLIYVPFTSSPWSQPR